MILSYWNICSQLGNEFWVKLVIQGRKLCTIISGNLYRYGYHKSGFNSIKHLHMHCFGLPFKNQLVSYIEYKSFEFIKAQTLIYNLKTKYL